MTHNGESSESESESESELEQTKSNLKPVSTIAHSTAPMVQEENYKIIVHIDIDCFYCQVEMILNPRLVDKPIGVQQKFLVVSTNYVARGLGVKKMTSVKDALRQCPNLILINGEDLFKYRDMSDRIYSCLQTFSPLVEKLGFDENYIDVTEIINCKLRSDEPKSAYSVVGHLYGHDAEEIIQRLSPCRNSCEERLAIGSFIAQDMRSHLKSELGITSCAGIATNKLLAKLAGATHKPDQQTTVYPESAMNLVTSLKKVISIPGVGSTIAQKLEEIGIISIDDLRQASIATLSSILGDKLANRIQQLSFGVDNSKVKVTDRPLSIGAEDGFPIIRTLKQARHKLEILLHRVLLLVDKDGRRPSTMRLSVRKVFHLEEGSKTNSKESRQCSVDCSLQSPDALNKLINKLASLFEQIVEATSDWQVTQVGITFTDFSLAINDTHSLKSYFGCERNVNNSPSPSRNVNCCSKDDCFQKRFENNMHHRVMNQQDINVPPAKKFRSEENCSNEVKNVLTGRNQDINSSSANSCSSTSSSNNSGVKYQGAVNPVCPKGLDPEVFNLLPRNIQLELAAAGAQTQALTTIKLSNLKSKNSVLNYFKKPS